MGKNLLAKATIVINSPINSVWQALTNPDAINQYMFGTHVHSDWQEGSPITWKGEWQGRAYEDKGTILKIKPDQLIQYSHFSPLSGLPDIPENYHAVTIELSANGNQTQVNLTQDNNATEDERTHSEKNWMSMLDSLKEFLEQGRSR